jgi:gamma-glutamyltranspeptidase/glutathione hydrolase
VAAGHDQTVNAATQVLAEGGTAFDAVIAAMAMACVVEPALASLGGGGLLTAVPVGESPRSYNFFVQTPSERQPDHEQDFTALDANFGDTTQTFHVGMGAVAVPGVVKGLFAVHEDLGRLPMSMLLAPAVTAGRDGTLVRSFDARVLEIVDAIYRRDPACLKLFASDGDADALLRAGDTFRTQALADALEALGSEGADLFYRGEIGARIAAATSEGGHLTRADLEQYEVMRATALTGTYNGWQVLVPPVPVSGGVICAFGLELLNGFSVGPSGPGQLEAASLMAAAQGLTCEARAQRELAQGGVIDAGMLHGRFFETYRTRLANHPFARTGTTHISVLDTMGNAASATLSNGSGSGQVVDGTGIVLNNMLGEADLNRGGFNCWATGTRMTSMMTPTVARHDDGRLLVTGSGGSNRIRSAVLQVLVNVLGHGMDVADAVAAPRLHVEDEHLSVEFGFDLERLAPLFDEWPQRQVWDHSSMFFGGAHTVVGNGRGDTDGAGDPRRGGVCVSA